LKTGFIKGTVARTSLQENAMGCKPRRQLRIAIFLIGPLITVIFQSYHFAKNHLSSGGTLVMRIWYPVRSALYTGRSLPDTWFPERQLYWHPVRSHPADTSRDWRIGNIVASGTPILSH
jgi:hypothetical protein